MSGRIRGWKEYLRAPARELTFGGFLLYNHFDQLLGAFSALSRMLAEGRLKSAETTVRGGFERWAECVDRVYASDTFGRMILALE